MRTLGPVFAALCCLVVAAPAAAHIQLISPVARNTEQKTGPCGLAADQDMKGAPVVTYTGGETITVSWEETVNHPSHYRVSLDLDGQDDFVDPAAMDEYYSNDAVLLDEIADKAGGVYEVEVELPDVSCETCTLQVIQVMYDKPPFADGNDMYYQCADIVIEGAGVETTGTTGDPTTGDPSTSDGTTGMTDGTTGDGTTGDGTTDGTTEGGSSAGSATGSDTGSSSESAGPTAGSGDSTASSATESTTESATDSGAGDDDVACGCVQGSSGGAPWMAFGLLALAVRRRRRR